MHTYSVQTCFHNPVYHTQSEWYTWRVWIKKARNINRNYWSIAWGPHTAHTFYRTPKIDLLAARFHRQGLIVLRSHLSDRTTIKYDTHTSKAIHARSYLPLSMTDFEIQWIVHNSRDWSTSEELSKCVFFFHLYLFNLFIHIFCSIVRPPPKNIKVFILIEMYR